MAAAAVDSSSSQIQQQEQQQPPERLDHPRQRQSPSTPGPRPVSGAQPLYARAIWDYIAIEDNELSFVVGDIIEVLDRCNTDWYEGRLANEGSRDGNSQFVGYFPATRVWIIETPIADKNPQPPIAERSPAAAGQNVASTPPSAPAVTEPSPAAAQLASSPPKARSTLETIGNDAGNLSSIDNHESLDRDSDAQRTRTSLIDDASKHEATWELVENSEGHEYYWNTKTGETSWTSPFGTNGVLTASSDAERESAGAQHPIQDGTGDLMQDLTKVLDDFEVAGESSIHSSFSSSMMGLAMPKAEVPGTATPMSAVSYSTEAALIPELLSSGPPPPPPLPPVMKFPPPMSGAVPNDPELAALSRIESVPESIIRREGYLLTKKKSHGLASKKQSSSWVQHWAVLCVGFLFLFKDQATKTSTKRPLHVLRLDVVSVDEVGKEMTKKKGAFRLELEPGVVWLLQPGKEGEMWEWMDSVKEASRQKSTTPEYENALSKLLPATSGSERQAGSAHATRSSSNLSTVNSPATASTPVAGKSSDRNRSRRPTAGAKASGEVDDLSYEGKQAKQSVKTKIGAFLFKRPSVDKLKEQGIIKDEDVIFGGSLAHQVEHSAQPIPPVVRKCVEEVDKRGLTSQGIYRLSGNASTVQKLRLQFNSKEPVDLSDDDMDINVVASTLKLYFRELEDPLVPFGFYDRFIAAAKLDDYDTRLIELKNLVQALPRPNYDTFEYIIRHLARVTSHSAENKMEPSNLAIVFGPTLIRAPENGAQSGYNTILNMSYQNLLVEAVLVQVDWVFDGLDN